MRKKVKFMADVKFQIVKKIGVLSENRYGVTKGWKKELNIVSWMDESPKYDIRSWSPDHTNKGKGITLTREEAEELYELLGREFSKR